MIRLFLYRLFKKRQWIAALFISLACVDPIEFEVPPAGEQLVVEGQITDAPGPYTVKLSKGVSIGDLVQTPEPVGNATVTLFDDQGASEVLVNTGNGIYMTTGEIQGQVGHRYHIRIQVDQGTFESEPDLLSAVGSVTEITYEYEPRMKQLPFGEFRDDLFNIYINSDAGAPDDVFVRWRFSGAYRVETNPELNVIWALGFQLRSPLECSGYVVVPFIPGGKLEKRFDCTCCTCWAKHYETAPQLSDGQFIESGKFNHVKVGEVPINTATFYDKYMVQVDQISLSRTAFNFFKLVRSQKEGALSLFQPPSAEIRGNIKALNNSAAVAGIFYASSIATKTLFIPRSAVPYNLPPIDYVTSECYVYYANATTEKPALWQD